MTEMSTRVARVWLDDDGLINLEYFDGVTIEREDSEECLAAMQALTRGAPIRQLALIDGVAAATADAREFGATEEYASTHAAIALVTHKAIPRILGNFWMRVNKPRLPTRMFADIDEARAWLRSQ